MHRRSFVAGRTRGFALAAAFVGGAVASCAAAEGLDRYALCGADCVDGGSALLETSTGTDDGRSEDNGDSAQQGPPEPLPDGESPSADAAGGSSGGDSSGGSSGGLDASCLCVAAAPSGWTGYVQILSSDAGSAPCVAPYASAVMGTLKTAPSASPAQCTSCTCGVPPSGPIQCEVSLGSGGALCQNETMTVAPQGVCVVPPGPVGLTSGPNGDSYGPTAIPAPSGSCAPSGGSLAQALAPAQTTQVSACATASEAASSGTCTSSGEVCVPPPSSQGGSASGVCIYQAGVQTCPSGYSNRVVAAQDIVDTRGCGACACAAPACPADGYVQGYASINCTGTPATTFDASTACTLGDNANDSVSFEYFPSHSTWTGACAVSQAGGPDGGVAVDPATATTFCCVP